jgi:hypothetical protein
MALTSEERYIQPYSPLWNRSMIYNKICTHLCYFGSSFTFKFARARTRYVVCARFSSRNLGPICRYETNRRFMLKFVPIYALLVRILCWNPPEPESTHESDACGFLIVIFGPHSSLRNRYMIYAKMHTHLNCSSSCFTLKSARARTPARSAHWYTWGFHYLVLYIHYTIQRKT